MPACTNRLYYGDNSYETIIINYVWKSAASSLHSCYILSDNQPVSQRVCSKYLQAHWRKYGSTHTAEWAIFTVQDKCLLAELI